MSVKIFYHSSGDISISGAPGAVIVTLPVVGTIGDSHYLPAFYYREVILKLKDYECKIEDQARKYSRFVFNLKSEIEDRLYQKQAFGAWWRRGGVGVVSLPTGSGKTILGVKAIEKVNRETLVVVPTRILMKQWRTVLAGYFNETIGQIGDSVFDRRPLTVATYDSALLKISEIGNHFGFLIFDECHHLSSVRYQNIAINSIAPFRLGLSATPEGKDTQRNDALYSVCGSLCYQKSVSELSGEALADYKTVTVQVTLSREEKAEYEANRAIYLAFVRKYQINFGKKNGWSDFVRLSNRSPEDRKAFDAYLIQKRLSQSPLSKIKAIREILERHEGERFLIFAHENQFACSIGETFNLPVITYKTKSKQRKKILEDFKTGEVATRSSIVGIVTSKVLNEGLDVPEANIAIVVSGTGSVREHVQRLGRILRPGDGKEAIFYEIVSRGTGEEATNQRRRRHVAFAKE